MSSAQVLFVVCAMHDAGIETRLYILSLSCTSVIIIIAINCFMAQVGPKLAQIVAKLDQIPSSKLAQISSKVGEAEA